MQNAGTGAGAVGSQRPYRVGVIGTGGIGRVHARVSRASGRAEVVAGADVSVERLEDWARACEIERVYTDFESMLDREELDIVAVCTWPAAHVAPVLAAVKARHRPRLILCEKPLALSGSGARQMYAAATAAGVPLVEGFMYRYLPHVSFARQLIVDGAIGRPRAIRAGFTSPLADLANHRFNRDAGGGALLDTGSYCVNSARYLSGLEPEGALAAAVYIEESGVDEALYGSLRFPDGLMAHFDVAFRSSRSQFVEVIGDRGMLRLPDFFSPIGAPTILLTTAPPRTGGGSPREKVESFLFPVVDPYEAEYRGICAYLDGTQLLPMTPDEGVRDMAVIDALDASARTGGWADIAPHTTV
jgi:D-xylose 1-dehydrogenase (NADP+, D-xylono-1,5-lactone-forming)